MKICGSAYAFGEFLSEIRVLFFLEKNHKIVGYVYIFFLFDIPTVNFEGQLFRSNGFFLPIHGLYLPPVCQIPSSLRWGDIFCFEPPSFYASDTRMVSQKRWSVFNEDSVLSQLLNLIFCN